MRMRPGTALWRSAALCLAALAPACGPAPSQATTAATPGGAAAPGDTPPPASGSSGEPATAPASTGTPDTAAAPTAKVTEVVGSAESTDYMKVTAVFSNPSSAPCSIGKYTLVWSGGTKEIKLEAFTIPPGSSRQRSVKVHPNDGDLKTLTMQSARIELPAKCDKP